MAPKFQMKLEKCGVCEKTVYAAERIEAGGVIFHKMCFKCSVCKTKLDLGNYQQNEGIIYCKKDFRDAVTAKNVQAAVV
ncbi:PREDICTED: LIM domain-containing protein WLIM2a-like [Priapulus caudatus]|uniref:LIM domain-containing protein WLIM2a-like n=1 Tax=Priapulus caudatus TaxID=37621 RepID=A0ABM1ERD8_PRICU|nr:PREDICTED: LIM domain-containing protein WLIM2a-like [Priapulus caudatus]